MLSEQNQESPPSPLKQQSYKWQSLKSTLYIFTLHSFGVGFLEGLCPVVKTRRYQPYQHSSDTVNSPTQDRSIAFRL